MTQGRTTEPRVPGGICCKFLVGGGSQLGGWRQTSLGIGGQLKGTDEELGICSLLHAELELGLTCLKVHAQCLSVFKNHLPFDLPILWLENFIL